MKISHVLESYHDPKPPEYTQWQKDCRKECPDCQFAGTLRNAQAVWWNEDNNPIVGDWDGTKGVVYKLDPPYSAS